MIHKLQYTCKFCHRPGETSFDDANPLSEEQVVLWMKQVACDPCAKFHRVSHDMSRALYQAVVRWSGVRDTADDDTTTREKMRKRFSKILGRLAAAVADFRHISSPYDSNDVERLIDFPEQASGIISAYLRSNSKA